MHRLILGLVAGEPGAIARQRGAVDLEADLLTSFEGDALIEGKAVGTVTRTPDVPVVGDEVIYTESEERTERVLTEFVADLDSLTPYVAVDGSDGSFLWDWLELEWGVTIERARLDVDGIADRLRDLERAQVWQTGWNRDDGEQVGVAYHQDARLDDHHGGLTQLGFAADFGNAVIRGTLARSGYVAVFTDEPTEVVAAWVREEILPHAGFPDETQSTLDDETDHGDVAADGGGV